MDLIPSENDVLELLRKTGALRQGHFRRPDGRHAEIYLQLPLVMRHYTESKALSVGLSRLLRAQDAVRRHLPNISIVAPATGGLPVAYGVSEALSASQTYWAEKENQHLTFRQFMERHEDENVVLVDDLFRSGRKMRELKALVEGSGARVLAAAVLVHQMTGEPPELGGVPLLSLLRLEARSWEADDCPLCVRGEPLTELRV